MKKLLLLFSLFHQICSLQAQDNIPSFGKIDKPDLEMKDCDFDRGAEALVLIDFGDININYVANIGWISESNYRVRIKILKEKGINRAQIQMSYRSKSGLEDISGLRGFSFNLDASGNIQKSELENKSIYKKRINEEYTEISFALPEIRVGTVFEYKYKLTRKSYSYIPNWNFQQSIPVRYSTYNVIAPPAYLEFTSQSTVRQPMETESQSSDGKGSWYTMRNIPGLKNEPFSSGREDFLQRIEFQLSAVNTDGFLKEIRNTWPKIIDELLDDEEFGGVIKKNIKGTGDLDTLLSASTSVKEKIRIVYNYVQRNMQWNEYYGFIANDGIRNAWDKKNGSIAEINFILLSLLKEAGVKAKPLLISTKDNGRVNTFYPFINQFNGLMVYVKDGNDTYIMNAADKYNPFNLVPYDVIFTNALLVDKGEGGLIELHSDGSFSHNIYFTCSVETDGKVEGEANIISSGYARNVRMESYNKKRMKEIFEDNVGINIKADSISIKFENDELHPLEQKAAFTGSIQTGGEYSFLPFNLFTAMGKNPFIEENRVMDIDFYYPRSYTITGTYFLSDDFIVNELPKNTRLIMPDTSMVLIRTVQLDDHTISYKVNLDINTFGYEAGGYPFIKEFFKKMYAILDERIVLKKK
jgi:hypothetical protein